MRANHLRNSPSLSKIFQKTEVSQCCWCHLYCTGSRTRHDSSKTILSDKFSKKELHLDGKVAVSKNQIFSMLRPQLVAPHARGALLWQQCSMQFAVLAAPAKRKKERTESAMPSRGIVLSLILTSSSVNPCLELTVNRMNGSSVGQNICGLKHLSSS